MVFADAQRDIGRAYVGGGPGVLLPSRPALVFPLAAIAVGTHYAVFKTVYGDRLFWALGALVTVIGLLGVFVAPAGEIVAFLVAIAELAFGILLTARASTVRA